MSQTLQEAYEIDSGDCPPLDLVDMVRHFGGPASDAVLDPACRHFFTSSIIGFIGYRIEHDCAIVFGDPICAKKDWKPLIEAFELFCRENNKRVLYISMSESFASMAMKTFSSGSIEFGKEFFLDPHADPRDKVGVKGSLVRRKVRHALKEGVTIQEYISEDIEIEQEIEEVGTTWLQSRKGLQIHISHVRLFADRLGKRWFYALYQGKIVGILTLNQLQQNRGWLLNRYMVIPNIPGGTPELLVVKVLETLKNESCHYVSFGNVPLSDLGEIKGFGSFSTWFARCAFKGINRYFHLNGRREFWEKFHPESKSSYIIFKEPKIHYKEVIGLIRALNVAG